MGDPIVIVGVGEMAGVFARGFLRSGHPVFPVTRNQNMEDIAQELPAPTLTLVAVAEADLHRVLDDVPSAWRDRLGLLQNELLPRDWLAHDLTSPTVISVWFEKKKGQDSKVLIPSPVWGPNTDVIQTALANVDIPTRSIASDDELLFELVRKNVYILTTNIAGLVTAGTVAELWQNHEDLAREVANEVMDIQAWLTDQDNLPRERLITGMLEAFDGDPEHKCMGRSAPARLQRALACADEAGLAVPKLREIATTLKSS